MGHRFESCPGCHFPRTLTHELHRCATLAENDGIIGPIWTWDAEEKAYHRVRNGGMEPGKAYWIYFRGGDDDTIDTGSNL